MRVCCHKLETHRFIFESDAAGEDVSDDGRPREDIPRLRFGVDGHKVPDNLNR